VAWIPVRIRVLRFSNLRDETFQVGIRLLPLAAASGLLVFLYIYMVEYYIDLAKPVIAGLPFLIATGPLAACSIRQRWAFSIASKPTLLAGVFSTCWASASAGLSLAYLAMVEGIEVAPASYLLACSGMGVVGFLVSLVPLPLVRPR